jgi:hypothetical protein
VALGVTSGALRLRAAMSGFRADLLHALWIDHEVGIGMVSMPALVMAYFGAGLGALRTYSSNRTRKIGRSDRAGRRRPGSASFLKAMVKRK